MEMWKWGSLQLLGSIQHSAAGCGRYQVLSHVDGARGAGLVVLAMASTVGSNLLWYHEYMASEVHMNTGSIRSVLVYPP